MKIFQNQREKRKVCQLFYREKFFSDRNIFIYNSDAVFQNSVKNHFTKQNDPFQSKLDRQFSLEEEFDKLCEANQKYMPFQKAVGHKNLEEESSYCKVTSNEGQLLNIAKLFLSHFGLLNVKLTKVYSREFCKKFRDRNLLIF